MQDTMTAITQGYLAGLVFVVLILLIRKPRGGGE
jgi:hypothetical protein